MSKTIQKLEQTQRLNPKQILEASIMQLNIFNLEKRVLEEVEKNPALEIEDNSNDESNDSQEDEFDEFDFEELVSNPDEYEYINKNRRSDYSNQLTDVQSVSLYDDILSQMNELNANEDEIKIAKQILGNLDEDGFLPIELVLIADRLGFKESYVEEVKNKIQNLDPPGIGSLSIEECIISQLKKYYPNDNLSLEIIEKYFDDFSKHKYNNIAKKLNCSKDVVYKTAQLISALNPSPAINYNSSKADHILPDLIIEEIDGDWDVQINELNIPNIKISQQYIHMLRKYNDNNDVKKFVKQKLNNAEWFISAINQRNNTIRKVMKSIIKKQSQYFDSDKRILIPMILKDLAQDINMDISTVSRVCNGKYVQMPWGIKELKSFFSEGIKMNSGKNISSLVVKDILKDMINNENKSSPYNDEKLTNQLNKLGYIIARRTVTKYRESLKIPISRLRKI